MANKQRAEHRAASQQRNRIWMWAGIVLVVALAAGVAIWSASGEDAAVSEGTVSSDGGASSVAETQPVAVTGDPLPELQREGVDPAVGTKAPILEGYSFDGTPITIDAADGPVMLVFLAHWCHFCNEEVPKLVQWKQSGAVPPDLRVIAVATAASPDRENYPPSEWFERMGWPWPTLVDSADFDAARAYGLSAFPFFTIVGDDGLVKVRLSGVIEPADLQKIVADALAS